VVLPLLVVLPEQRLRCLAPHDHHHQPHQAWEGGGRDCCPPEVAKPVAESEAASAPMVISSSSRSLWASWKEGNDTTRLSMVLMWSYPLFNPPRMFRMRVQSGTGSLRSRRTSTMPFILRQCQYALNILEHAGMTDCKPYSIRVDTHTKVSSDTGWSRLSSTSHSLGLTST
jgi:hypothetical protein